MMGKIDLCRLCSRKVTSACQRCENSSCFRPDVSERLDLENPYPGYYPDPPKTIFGVEDLEGLSPMGVRALMLYLVQRE